jgi:hypothetical protein
MTADQLAHILRVEVRTARYSGGPIKCWLEIEEEGQSTIPKRIPPTDSIQAAQVNPPAEGTIEIWWRREGWRQLVMSAPNGMYAYSLAEDAFTFAWKRFGAVSTPKGRAN